MSIRLDKWLDELRGDVTDNDIAAGLGNGDIDCPGEWLSIAESTDHAKIWGNETEESQQMRFVYLPYGDGEE